MRDCQVDWAIRVVAIVTMVRVSTEVERVVRCHSQRGGASLEVVSLLVEDQELTDRVIAGNSFQSSIVVFVACACVVQERIAEKFSMTLFLLQSHVDVSVVQHAHSCARNMELIIVGQTTAVFHPEAS